MKRMTAFIILATLLALTIVACSGEDEPTPAQTPEPASASLVSVTGEVVPAKWAALSVQTDGVLAEVLVEPGDNVQAGDLLLRLDPVDAELAVQEAEARLVGARAKVGQLEAQPRALDVVAAEQQLAEAETGVAQAMAERDRLASNVIGSDIADAEAELESAEAEQESARIDYDELQDELEDDNVEDWEGQRAALRLRAAGENAEAARLNLAYARGSAGARMEEAEAGVRAAEGQRDVAKAQLAQIRAGVLQEDIALAATEVDQAETALQEAQLTLERCERHAPFDGTIGMVEVRQGEQVRQGDPVVTLGDLATLRVETTDLDEIDVAKVDVGQSVAVTFDAFPDRVFNGRVVRINPMAEAGGGGVNYTTIIELDELSPDIRWGMTAFVDIDLGQ